MRKQLLRQQKQAQGISLNTIVIAAIVLIVLIVTIAIIVNKSSLFSSSIDDCPSKFKGASCKAPSECGPLRFGKIGCTGENICCISAPDKKGG
ncbi:MAG: hypothetical protein GXP63_02635 [DPANN group archaeon]|nr:hypothetical protein [DPANN group archaeon]